MEGYEGSGYARCRRGTGYTGGTRVNRGMLKDARYPRRFARGYPGGIPGESRRYRKYIRGMGC